MTKLKDMPVVVDNKAVIAKRDRLYNDAYRSLMVAITHDLMLQDRKQFTESEIEAMSALEELHDCGE